MLLLIPLYSVFSQGLQNYNPQSMLDVFGVRILDLQCQAAPLLDATKQHVLNPCLDPNAFLVDWGVPEVYRDRRIAVLRPQPAGHHLLAGPVRRLADDDAGDGRKRFRRCERQDARQMAIFLPFISLIYGSILQAGLFLYWIVSTVFSIVQQYLIIGWGGMSRSSAGPGFAVGHTPRFPVAGVRRRHPPPRVRRERPREPRLNGRPSTGPHPRRQRSASAAGRVDVGDDVEHEVKMR